MTIITTTDVTNGTVIDANVLNNNNQAIRQVVNGQLDNGNVAGGAGIDVAKLAPGDTDGQVLTTTGGVPAWVATTASTTYGTALPSTPDDGAVHIFVDSTTNPTYQWHLRFNAGSANSDKWEYIGGAAGYNRVDTSEGTTSSSFVALATPGPSFTVPLAGVYLIETGAFITWSSPTGVQQALFSYDIGATGAVDADSVSFQNDRNSGAHVSQVNQKTIAAASTALVAKYRRSSGNVTMTFSDRYLRVTPIRVS